MWRRGKHNIFRARISKEDKVLIPVRAAGRINRRVRFNATPNATTTKTTSYGINSRVICRFGTPAWIVLIRRASWRRGLENRGAAPRRNDHRDDILPAYSFAYYNQPPTAVIVVNIMACFQNATKCTRGCKSFGLLNSRGEKGMICGRDYGRAAYYAFNRLNNSARLTLNPETDSNLGKQHGFH